MRSARYIFAAACVAVLVACGAASAEAPTVPAAAPADPTADVARYKLWTDAVRLNQTIAWNAAVAAHEAELAAQAEAQRQRDAAVAANARARQHVPSNGNTGTSNGNVGGACGGATNGADRFIGRESGGNPNARNSSGAWGCYQIMPDTWRSSCSDLGQHGSASTDAQAQCASRLPSSSWSASGPT